MSKLHRTVMTAAFVLSLLPTGRAEAFRVFVNAHPLDYWLQASARWAAQPEPPYFSASLQDGLEVCIAPNLAEDLGAVTPLEIAIFENVVRAAFTAWESPVLHFELMFDCSFPPAEISLQTVSDPFSLEPAVTEFLFPDDPWPWVQSRMLTNGQSHPGFVIEQAWIRLNLVRIGPLLTPLPPGQRLAALQRLLMHEVGHAIGAEHPAGTARLIIPQLYVDHDADPFNPMVFDPQAPFAGIIASPNYDPDAIMMHELTSNAARFLTALRNDDRAVRDALYPLPPPDSDGDGTPDATDPCRLTPGLAGCLVAVDAPLLNAVVGNTPNPPGGTAELVRLQPGALAYALYKPSGVTSGSVRFAPFAPNALVAAVPLTPVTWQLRLADLARGFESVIAAAVPRPLDLAVDAAGKVVLALPGSGGPATIARMDPIRGTSTPIASISGSVGALALDLDRTTVIAAVSTAPVASAIRRFNPDGTVTDLATFPTVPSPGLAVEKNGDVLFAAPDIMGMAIHRITRATGAVNPLATGFSFFSGLALASDGYALVSWRDSIAGERLTRINPLTGAQQNLPVAGYSTVSDAAPGLRAMAAFPFDADADGIGAADSCPYARNPDQRNSDGQGGGDVCDPCPLDPLDLCTRAETASGSIGPAGGTLATPSGSIGVQVPPGALASEISLSISNTAVGFERTGHVPTVSRIELGPDGLSFAVPITVTVQWVDANNDGRVDLQSPNVLETGLHLLRNGYPMSEYCNQPPHVPATCAESASCCDAVANRWTFEVASLSEYRLDGALDADADVFDVSDNCPFVFNPSQNNVNGGSRGDACTCGDMSRNGAVDAPDETAMREALAGIVPPVPGLTPHHGKCNVRGQVDPRFPLDGVTMRDCTIEDLVVLQRALAGLAPGLGTSCKGSPEQVP